MHIISLGAGVQSSTMALMAAHGEITPMPDCAVFADTQAEPKSVYAWLDWLERQLPFPVHRVTQGDFALEAVRLRTSKNGVRYQKHSPPAFTKENGRASGMLMRQCTQDFKLAPLYRQYRKLGGKRSGCTQWIGISLDEVERMKPPPAKHAWLFNRFPLIDAGITRSKCLQWMTRHGYPAPPRSACVFCPYHSNAEWQDLKTHDPEAFAVAVSWEKSLQAMFAKVNGFRGEVYLHRELVPLDQVDFEKASPQMDMFADECEGMCGV